MLDKELKKAEERADSNQKKIDSIDEELKVGNMMRSTTIRTTIRSSART